MKQIQKIALFDMDRKLTRNEMSKVLAGTIKLANAGDDTGGGSGESYSCSSDADCKRICDRQQAYCANYASLPRTCLLCCN